MEDLTPGEEHLSGAVYSLALAVMALIETHPRPDLIRDTLSRYYSGMLRNNPALARPSARAGWEEILGLMQTAAQGFPVVAGLPDDAGPTPDH